MKERSFYMVIILLLIVILDMYVLFLLKINQVEEPYKELIEITCPETEPEVHIDSDKIIRIIYDCSNK